MAVTTVERVLRCECGHAERWRLPLEAVVRRCTCPRCGEPMAVLLPSDGAESRADVAFDAAC